MLTRSPCLLTGRIRGVYMKPTQLARKLLPNDQLWCKTCHRVVEKKYWEKHLQSRDHSSANHKLNNLKALSLDMWSKHRKSSLTEESGNDASIEREFQLFRRNQQQAQGRRHQ